MVTTSHDQFGSTDQKSGLWYEELAAPYYVFRDAGCSVSIASIKGGRAPVDPQSMAAEWQTDATRRFDNDPIALRQLSSTLRVEEVDAEQVDVVFLPGGFATMWDFPSSHALQEFLGACVRNGALIGTVCHAAAALVELRGENGEPLVSGRTITCFSDSEERAVGADQVVPFLLESSLRDLGANVITTEDWGVCVSRDVGLVTGQNPASAGPTARAVLEQWASREMGRYA